MLFIRRLLLMTAMGLLALAGRPSHADETPFADRLKPHLTESAVATIRVPLETLQTTAVGEIAESLGFVTDDIRTPLQTALISIDALRGQLLAHGVTDAVMVFETEYVMQGPYGVFLYRESAKPERIQATLSAAMNLAGLATGQVPKIVDLGGAFFVGPEPVLQRLRDPFPVDRPGLAGAFESVGDATVQMVVAPSVDQLRVLREILPAFPAPFDAVDGKLLSRGLKFAALGIRFESEPAGANLRIAAHLQAFDADAAAVLRTAQHQALRLVVGNANLVAAMPKIPAYSRLFEFQQTEDRLTVSLDLQDDLTREMLTTLGTIFEPAQMVNNSSRVVNDLKQLGLAFHNWHDNFLVFPAHANYSADGKPLLSWRVHILPYIGQQALYAEFRLDEPWDSDHNRKLIPRIPERYRFPGSKAAEGMTCYVLPIIPDDAGITTGTRFGVKFQEILDGTSNTVLVVASDDEHAVTWTQPVDLPLTAENPFAGLRTIRDAYVACFADGSVRWIATTVAKEEWWKALTKDGKEPVNLP